MLEPEFENNGSFPIRALMFATKEALNADSRGRIKDLKKCSPKKVRFALPLTVDLVAEAEAKNHEPRLTETDEQFIKERCGILISKRMCRNKRFPR